MTTPTDKSEVSLPEVAGRMEMTHDHFQRACQVLIGHEQSNHISCDTALVRVLCEAVRCSRECCELAGGSETKAKFDALESQLTDLSAQVETLKIERDEARVARDFADLACERREADCAVMRGALEKCHRTFLVLEEKEGFSTPVAPNIALQSAIAISTALSTNSGRDLLARYREAVELLKLAEPPMVKRDAWMTRWNTLLATVKGGV